MTRSEVRSGPEVLFDVEPAHVLGDTASAAMPLGPWLAGPDGSVGAGALGVLVDGVLGLAIIGERPDEHWSVSSEITVDVFGGLATASGRVQAQASVVDRDDVGAFSTGTVRDHRGALLAVVSQRGRHVPGGGMVLDTGYRLDPARRAGDLVTLLGLTRVGDGWALPVSPSVANPLDRLHGGVALAACDLAAFTALAALDGPPLATVGIRVHYRRPVPSGVLLELHPVVEHRGRSSGVVRVDGVVDGRTCVSAIVSAGPAPLPIGAEKVRRWS